MSAKGRDMTLKILACRHVYSARNARGDQYMIYEVDAAKSDGSQIREKLRSFHELPIGQMVEVTVTAFDSERYGRSFTLHPKNGSSPSPQVQINELREELDAHKETISRLVGRVETLELQLVNGGAAGATPPARPAQSTGLDQRFGADAPW